MSATTIDNIRHKGHVKFFNSVKGFGFIIPDRPTEGNENEEVFVHHTAIYNNGGFKSLAEGEEVEFDLIQGPKGMQASNVTGPDGTPVKGDPRAPYHRNQASGGYRRNNNFNQSNYSNIYTAGGIYLDPYGMPMSHYGDIPLWATPYSTNSGDPEQQQFSSSLQQQQQSIAIAGSNNSSHHHQGYNRLPPQFHSQQQFHAGVYAPPMFQQPPPPTSLIHQPQPVVPPNPNANTPMFLYTTNTPPFPNTNRSSGATSPSHQQQQQQQQPHTPSTENNTTS